MTRRTARRALAWTLLLFAAGQAAVGVYLTRVRPDLRDPEFETVRKELHDRLAAAPGRPLVLVLGSSRAATMFRPNALAAPPPGQPVPLVHNCAFLASGPVRELLMLRRLLDEGFRPDWLFVEVWPAYLAQRGMYWEEASIIRRQLRLGDWKVLTDYFGKPGDARGLVLTNELFPGFAYRHRLLQQFAPDLLPLPQGPVFVWENPPRPGGEAGWMVAPGVPPDPIAGARNAQVFRVGMRALCDPFVVYPAADRALRDLLKLAGRHGARVALVLYPDHSAMRDAGSPEVADAYHRYLAGLSAAYGVPVLDTRTWIADSEFTDPTHAQAGAAGPFTERFGREILYPLLAGRSLAPSVLLRTGDADSPPEDPFH